MNAKIKRLLKWALISILCIFALWRYSHTDEKFASGPVEVPLGWLDENTLLTGERSQLFLRKNGNPRAEIIALEEEETEFAFGSVCISEDLWRMARAKVRGSLLGRVEFEIETGNSGEVRVGNTTFFDLSESWGIKRCKESEMAQAELAVLRANSTLPKETLVRIKSGYQCFSCGCECYANEEIHAAGGVIYAHVWGYPVENDVRGIYRLKQSPDGPIWEKIVSGRPRPPLMFSPSGDKVAYFEMSKHGDKFMITEIGTP